MTGKSEMGAIERPSSPVQSKASVYQQQRDWRDSRKVLSPCLA